MEHVVYIKCLCFLMDSPINRDLERCDETIPQLIKTMDNIKQLHNDMVNFEFEIIITSISAIKTIRKFKKDHLSSTIVLDICSQQLFCTLIFVIYFVHLFLPFVLGIPFLNLILSFIFLFFFLHLLC